MAMDYLASYQMLYCHAFRPISERVPLLEYRYMEVNYNIYNIGAPTFSVISQNPFFFLSAIGTCTKKYDY